MHMLTQHTLANMNAHFIIFAIITYDILYRI